MSGKVPVVIVSGATKGIGLAIAQYLIKEHCNIVIAARSKEELEKMKSNHSDQIEVVAGDLSDFSICVKAIDVANATWGRIDSVVVNHGVLEPMKRISEANVNDWRKSFDINFFSALAMAKAAIPALRKSAGRIIFTSSGAAENAYSAWGAYGASKAAMNHLAMTIASEEPEITSISIRPGVVDTSMQRELREIHCSVMDAKDNRKFADLKSSDKLLKPSQPGNVIARLAISATRDLTGKFLSWNDDALASFQDED